ncbi:hypothetical protein SLA2020_103680 [Shorea laevis]
MRENGVLQSIFADKIWQPRLKLPARYPAAVSFFVLFLLVGALVSTHLLDSTALFGVPNKKQLLTATATDKIPKKPQKKIEIPLNCTALRLTKTCPTSYPTTQGHLELPSPEICPEYFRWIHEDLRPWAYAGITRDMVDRAQKTANFKLIIVNGRVYMERYHRAFQTRDVFTLWGILQLLRTYPGKVPDLELMFDCVDWPVIKSSDYAGPNASAPPPLFRYCADDETLDIVFPDWSFWGWPEINIKPWESLLNDLAEGNNRTGWMEREPYAYWKGNPAVAKTRQDLLRCNVSDKQDWGARVYAQDWIRESKQGYKQSDLASQCTHRFKIYIEGSAWSVSAKYILACDSVTLLIKPRYYDFFTRGLMPLHHYWPVKDVDKCKSIKYAVDWGNNNTQKAHAIGRAASEFILRGLKMGYVYDYMFHLLNEYAKLLRFKPEVPKNAVEVCSESMACPARGLEKKFMVESLVKSPSDTSPCRMPPPYDPASLYTMLRTKEDSVKRVNAWEKFFWENKQKENK